MFSSFSPRAKRSRLAATTLQRRSAVASVLLELCGVISTLGSSWKGRCDGLVARRAFQPHARAKKLPRAAECLVHSLTPSGVLAENHPKNRGFGILRGQKCLKRGQKCLTRRFSRRSPVGEWSRGARSMPRVFGRGSRSQPSALVSDRNDAALFPAIRILERYGSAKSGRARRVRAGSLR